MWGWGGGGTSAYFLRPPAGAHEQICDYKMHNIFGNYSSHRYIKIHSTLLPILNCFLKIFSEEHTRESSSNEIELRYTHHTINNASGTGACPGGPKGPAPLEIEKQKKKKKKKKGFQISAPPSCEFLDTRLRDVL